VIARHYPEAAEAERPYRALLDGVVARQAALIPRWLLVGFIHGVMNTDNMQVAGETIDYGPCAFMDEYDPGTVFSSIDVQGRYAYGNQPRIALWNLTRLAETLLPLLHEDPERAVADAEEALGAFARTFETHYHSGLRRKLGLLAEQEGDMELAGDLMKRMAENSADFTLTFRHLAAAARPDGDAEPARSRFIDPTSFDAWAEGWRARLAQDGQDPEARRSAMLAANPAFIPRNHRVEAAIQAGLRDDFAPFEELVEVLSRPYEDQPGFAAYMEPPEAHQRVTRTFCGT
jgi:uncharacterized protein YdiU (UPF0061 family)